MAAAESAVCEHDGVNWEIQYRSVTDHTRLTFREAKLEVAVLWCQLLVTEETGKEMFAQR
jgi:hypothetical protein